MGSMTDLQSEGWKNSPGKRRMVPYTISAAVAEILFKYRGVPMEGRPSKRQD